MSRFLHPLFFEIIFCFSFSHSLISYLQRVSVFQDCCRPLVILVWRWADMEVPKQSFNKSSWDSRTCYPRRAFNQGLTNHTFGLTARHLSVSWLRDWSHARLKLKELWTQRSVSQLSNSDQRSDPWAGLIASCGSFYPMVHHSAAHSLDTSLTCGTSLWLIFGCPDYFLRNGVHISAGPEEVNRKELASVKPSARKWEWEKRRPENQPSNSGSTVHQIKS